MEALETDFTSLEEVPFPDKASWVGSLASGAAQ